MFSSKNNSITNLRSDLKRLLVQGIDLVFSDLDQKINPDSNKFNDLVHLKSSYSAYQRDLLYGLVVQTDLDLRINKIRQALLHFIDNLQEADLATLKPQHNPSAAKTGRILYQIPPVMPLQKESKCVIRVGRENIDLETDLKSTYETSSIRIADIMVVDLIDYSEESTFSIRALNDKEQFIDKDEFTQWMFFVKPTAVGTHPLMLKISVVELINGVERKKDIVFEKQIEVSTAAPAEVAPSDFVESDVVINLGGAPLTQEKSNTLQTILSGIKKGSRVTLLLSLLFLVSFSFTFAQIQERWDWYQIKKSDKKAQYEEYLENYPNGRYRKDALLKLKSFESVAVDTGYIVKEIPVENAVEESLQALAKEDLEIEEKVLPEKVKAIEVGEEISKSKKDKDKESESEIKNDQVESDHEGGVAAVSKTRQPDTLIVIRNANGDVLRKKINGAKNNKANKAKIESLKSKEVKFPIVKWEKELEKSFGKLRKLNNTVYSVNLLFEEDKKKDFDPLHLEIDSLNAKFARYSASLLTILAKDANVNQVYTTSAYHENYFYAINNKVTLLDAQIYKVISKFMTHEIDAKEVKYWRKEMQSIATRLPKMIDLLEGSKPPQ